jgi:hypothetical protein
MAGLKLKIFAQKDGAVTTTDHLQQTYNMECLLVNIR